MSTYTPPPLDVIRARLAEAQARKAAQASDVPLPLEPLPSAARPPSRELEKPPRSVRSSWSPLKRERARRAELARRKDLAMADADQLHPLTVARLTYSETGLSQQALADAATVGRSQIQRAEAGAINLRRAFWRRVAAALNMDAEALQTDEQRAASA